MMLTITVLLLLFPCFNSLVITDNPGDIHYALFGDLSDMDRLFMLPLDANLTDTSDDKVETSTSKPKTIFDMFPEIYEMFHIQNSNKSFFTPEHALNMITKDLKKHTRRWDIGFRHGSRDPEDFWASEFIEWWKKLQLVNLNIQFLLHARYKISFALKQREPLRENNMYRIGYLFSKLRCLKTMQTYLVSAAETFIGAFRVKLLMTLRFYRKIVRLDVDMKQLRDYIIKVDEDIQKEQNKNREIHNKHREN